MIPPESYVGLPDGAVDELRAFVARVEPLVADAPGPHTLPVDEMRRIQAEQAPPRSPRAVTDTAVVDHHAVPIRIFPTESPARGVYLHLHGGGWTMGGADQQDDRLQALADDHALAVVSVDYRLAPERPLPAGTADVVVAAQWLADLGPERFGTDRFVIGGESAGAHLAVLALVELRDRHGLTGLFRAANLVYPCADLALSPSARARGTRRIVLSTPIIAWHAAQALGGADPADPTRSPVHADLRDLPAALFSVGDDDPLVDDSVQLHRRWIDAGNVSRLDVYEAGYHAFNLFPGLAADVCNRRQVDFLVDAVS